MKTKPFVLVTAAYNEERTIAKTMESVAAQTNRPVEWIIISDGSVDGTDAVVTRYAKKHSYIRYFRIERGQVYSFCAKVNAVNVGLSRIKTRRFDYMGILDADISLGETYYEEIIDRFERNPRLGIGGGNVIQYDDGRFFRRLRSFNSVAGAVQLFRRECFEGTGGFIPIEYGGEDAAIEVAARMNGWEVRTFPEIVAVHHGITGKGAGGLVRSRFKNGKMYFVLGYHPAFEIARCILRLATRPYLVGSVAELAGFLKAAVKHRNPILPPEIIGYLREEQVGRLRSAFLSRGRIAIGC